MCEPVIIDDYKPSLGDSDLLPVPTDLVPSAADHSKSKPPDPPTKPERGQTLNDICANHCCNLGPGTCYDDSLHTETGVDEGIEIDSTPAPPESSGDDEGAEIEVLSAPPPES